MDGVPVQAFTAIGQVTDTEPFQVEVSPDFHPWRRNVRFEHAHDAPIKPLIDSLDFIQDKTHWGYKFRLGVIEITEHDFTIIKQAMTRA